MMGYWRKLGLVYAVKPEGRHPKILTHAANPTAVHVSGDVFRIFYSSRDVRNRSSVGGVDLNLVSLDVVRDYVEPFFIHGADGSFYADGVSVGNVYASQGKRYMLFMGWQNPPDGHWRGDIGRLVVNDDLTLDIESEEPFLGMADEDALSLSYPWVHQCDAGGYKMWYGSTSTWDAGNGEMLHVIKGAESIDGHRWTRTGLAVPVELGKYQAFSRPCVLVSREFGWEMWFSYRGSPPRQYRVGYARSADGVDWIISTREPPLDVSDDGWDSEMVEYPYVILHRGRRYMLYNGNGYGKSGFGVAIWESGGFGND
jgi:hypothetical protein